MKQPLIAIVLFALCLITTPVLATSLTETQSFSLFDLPQSTVLSFDQFDTLGGTRQLDRVSLSMNATTTGRAAVQNTSSVAGFFNVIIQSELTGTGPSGLVAVNPTAQDSAQAIVPAGAFHDFGLLSDSQSSSNSITSGFAPFIGLGTVDFTFAAQGLFVGGGTTDADMQFSDFDAIGDATVTYEYSPAVVVPEPMTMVSIFGGMLAAGGYLRHRLRKQAVVERA